MIVKADEYVDPAVEAFAEIVRFLDAGDADEALGVLRRFGRSMYSEGFDEGHAYGADF